MSHGRCHIAFNLLPFVFSRITLFHSLPHACCLGVSICRAYVSKAYDAYYSLLPATIYIHMLHDIADRRLGTLLKRLREERVYNFL